MLEKIIAKYEVDKSSAYFIGDGERDILTVENAGVKGVLSRFNSLLINCLSQLYVDFNGAFYQEDDKVFTVNNRAFKYGDALFETIRVINEKVCFLEDHIIKL